MSRGKKTRYSWWNKPFTGKWLWGAPIGFGISLFIASPNARWLVFTLLGLGCLFAIVFHLIRRDDEM